MFRRCREQVICQNKKTRLTYASRVWQGRRDSPFSDRWRGERDRTFKPFARSRATRMRSILACFELAPHPAKIKKTRLTYASRVWQGRRDSPFSDRWRGERARTFNPFARSRATRMRSILACFELAPDPAKIKKHDLLTQAVFGRGDAIRLSAIVGEESATERSSCSPDRVQRVCAAYLRVSSSRPTLPK